MLILIRGLGLMHVWLFTLVKFFKRFYNFYSFNCIQLIKTDMWGWIGLNCLRARDLLWLLAAKFLIMAHFKSVLFKMAQAMLQQAKFQIHKTLLSEEQLKKEPKYQIFITCQHCKWRIEMFIDSIYYNLFNNANLYILQHLCAPPGGTHIYIVKEYIWIPPGGAHKMLNCLFSGTVCTTLKFLTFLNSYRWIQFII